MQLGFSAAPIAGDPLTILGFGLQSEGGENSDTLQKGLVNYVDDDVCAGIFASVNQIQPDIMLCAAGPGVDA